MGLSKSGYKYPRPPGGSLKGSLKGSIGFLNGPRSLSKSKYPDPREDLESRSPNLGPYTAKGTL